MRIVGGTLKNQKLKAPDTGKTRPMTDEMREAVFNILGPIDGFRVLDVYAGSGAIGFEAISRGAAHVDAIEKSDMAAQAIRENVERLGIKGKYTLFQQPVENWLKEVSGREYDLLFVDPPFAEFSMDVVKRVAKCLQPSGLLELRVQKARNLPVLDNMTALKEKVYGGSRIIFYRFSKAN